MEKIMLGKDAYVQAVAEYRSRYGYEDMTQEEKIAFDQRLDQAVGLKEDESGDQTDAAENSDSDDSDRFRSEMRDKYGYEDMSDEEKADFDSKLDEVLGTGDSDTVEGADDEGVDPPVRKLVRR